MNLNRFFLSTATPTYLPETDFKIITNAINFEVTFVNKIRK